MNSHKTGEIQKDLDAIMTTALAKKVFSAASGAFSYKKRDGDTFERKLCSWGTTERIFGKKEVTEDTLFDVASLSKPLVTVTLLLILIENGDLSLESSLADILPGLDIVGDKKDIRLWQLMAHCGGLPAYRPYYIHLLGISPNNRKEAIVEKILKEPLAYAVGSRHEYSDLGYILLGYIVEKKSRISLAEYFTKTVVNELQLSRKLVFPTKGSVDVSRYAATRICPWDNALLCGVVDDDNCRVMGGVAGHAGLFATAAGVLELCMFLLNVWQGRLQTPLFSAGLVRKVMTRVDNSTWTCGFDTPTLPYSSSGNYFSPQSVGHLGFTGTSFWVDLEKEAVIVLLTNRVHPDGHNEMIKRLRPRFHNAIMAKL